MVTQELVTVIRVIPYPLEEHGGVARNAQESAGHLEPHGFNVITVGPSKEGVIPDPSITHYGKTIFTVPHDGTKNELVGAREKAAVDLVYGYKPDIVHTDEPAAAFGQLFPLLIKSPRREDGQRIPVFGATVHARLDEDKFRFKLVKGAGYIIPLVGTHGYVPLIFHRPAVYIPESLRGRLIAVSQGTADYWRQKFPDDYEIIYNGIDTEMFIPDGPLIEQWLDGKKTMLMVGRHDKRKGMDTGIQTYALLRQVRDDVKLKIAGKGAKTDELKRLVKELQLPDVEFTGMLEPDELPKAYRTADVFVSPATGGEGFGRVLAEAMACGTPTVGSNIPGYQEAMQGQPFTRMPQPFDIDGFARAIGELLDIPYEIRRVWNEEAHRYVERNFGWAVIAPKQASSYRKWLDQHGQTPRSDWPERRKSRMLPKVRFPRRGLVFKDRR